MGESIFARATRGLLELGFSLIGLSFSPRDRILSAISDDGINWQREPGVRIDAGYWHNHEMVYYCYVVSLITGGYRMYYHGSILQEGKWRGWIRSAISKDGLQWEDESEACIPFGGTYDILRAQAPSLISLPTGDWRMYYTGFNQAGTGNILSAISSDGIRWEKEPGIRVAPTAFSEVDTLLDSYVVSLEDGRMRLYLSVAEGSLTNICSAISSDGIHWEPEDGVRISNGKLGRMLTACNPCVLKAQKDWRMYFRSGDKLALENKIYFASSLDGLEWQVQGVSLAYEKTHRYERHAVAFPFVMLLPDGRRRMYYTGFWGRHWREHKIITAWQQATKQALT